MHENLRTSARLAALIMAVATAAVGCGGSSAASPGAGGVATGAGGAATGAGTSPAVEEPQAPEDATAAAAPAAGGGERLISDSGVVLPKQIGAAAYTSNEYRDDQLAMFLPFKGDELDAVLDAQGRTRADTVLVVATPDDMTYPVVTAVRIDGAESQPLADAVAAGSLGDLEWTTAEMGGKTVATAKGALWTFILYATGDTMYLVTGNDAETLAAAVGLLP